MNNYFKNTKSVFIKFSEWLTNFWKLLGFEGLVWSFSILYLATLTVNSENHFTICPLANLGIDSCPGCGLGKSVSLILHGHIMQSFDYHYLGIPALIIILFRIYQIISVNYKIHFNSKIKGVNHA